MMQSDTHDRWSQLLPLYVNGRLEGEEREQLTRHLAGCARCQGDLVAWREIARLARLPDPSERHLLAPEVALTNLHHRLASRDDAPAKGSIMQPSIPPSTPSSSSPERRTFFPAIVVVVLLSLFVTSGFVLFRSHGTSHPTTPGAVVPTSTAGVTTPVSPNCQAKTVFSSTDTKSQAATVGQSVTVHGITMTLEKFYADFSRTIVLVNVRAPASSSIAYGPSDLSITPASGSAIDSSMLSGGIVDNPPSGEHDWQSFGLFSSLPAADFGASQTVTLSVSQMVLEVDKASQKLAGPWQLQVTFTSPPPHVVENLTCAVQTHHGFSIQPLSVAVIPAPMQFDGYPGGVKFTLCFAGLPNTQPGFDIGYFPTGQGSIGTPGGNPQPVTEPILTLPGGKRVMPPQLEDVGDSCTIDAQQGETFTLTYLTSLPSLTGRATFTVPAIVYSDSAPPAPGPWTFFFDLH